MSKSIAVFGAGPGLGQAVARRYAHEGYQVVLVGRRRELLDAFARDLAGAGARVHVLTANLADTETVAALAEQVRDAVGGLDAFYYAPTPDGGFVSATDLTARQAADFMPLAVYSLIALIQQFLPYMLEQGGGAILTAQGASALHGIPNLSGPGPAQAAQRNYLQSLHAELAAKGVYIGALYIGATIENSAFHTSLTSDPDAQTWGPTVHPDHLADLLWTMHSTREKGETVYPDR